MLRERVEDNASLIDEVEKKGRTEVNVYWYTGKQRAVHRTMH